MVKNKRGWVKIVEAFAAVLLISGVALLILGTGNFKKNNSSEKIYEDENTLLNKIQSNNTLRNKILEINSFPIEWEDANFPPIVYDTIQIEAPQYLLCEGKICEINDLCLRQYEEISIYSKEVIVSANLTNYSPRKLKLFCWEK